MAEMVLIGKVLVFIIGAKLGSSLHWCGVVDLLVTHKDNAIKACTHLEWIAQLSAAPETVPEPASPDKENDHISSSCPFSQGDIRLIVSEDETLGPVTKKE